MNAVVEWRICLQQIGDGNNRAAQAWEEGMDGLENLKPRVSMGQY